MNLYNCIKICSLLLIFIIGGCVKEEKPITPEDLIPNSEFEHWIKDDYNYDKPVGWSTSNFSLYGIVNFNPVFKDSVNNYSDKYCVQLQTQSQYINAEEVKVVGLITLGTFDINISTRKAQVLGGIEFSAKPKALTGYFKYEGLENDKCYIDVALMKKGADKSTGDTIAIGRFSSSTVDTWTAFQVPIEYRSDLQPEMLNIIILSSDTSIFIPGSTLWIDNLKFTY